MARRWLAIAAGILALGVLTQSDLASAQDRWTNGHSSPGRETRGQDNSIRLCVSAQRLPGGFVDSSRDVRDSIQDIDKRLRGKAGVVLDCLARPDARIVVFGRGVGSQSLGYAGGFAANSAGTTAAFAEQVSESMWVAAALYAPEGDRYVLVKPLVGTHSYQASNALNPYGGLGAIGGWGDCAKHISKDVVEWVVANREELIARRSEP